MSSPGLTPVILSALVALGMALQASTGLLTPSIYRDVGWIRATWFGNDLVTLVLGVPLLALGLVRRRSTRGVVLWLGLLAYALYNYAFYLLGAALNAHFPLYAGLVIAAGSALILALRRLDVDRVCRSFATCGPTRLLGGYLMAIGAGLALVWLALWAGYVFAGRALPVQADAFRLVAALDSTLLAPALIIGGGLLWRRRPWGFVIASISGIQGALYLLVLSVNSSIAIVRGPATAPGELPVWGTLTVTTTAAVGAFLACARDDGA